MQISCHFCGQRKRCFPAHLSRKALEDFDQIVIRPDAYDSDEVIIHEGDPFDVLITPRAGWLRQSIKSQTARSRQRREHIRQLCMPGEVMGLDAIGEPTVKASYIAMDKTFVCKIPYTKLALFGLHHPTVQKALVMMSSRHLRQQQERYDLIHGYTATEKLALFLINLARRARANGQRDTHFSLPMRQTEIAAYLDMAHETVNRQIKQLRKAGIANVADREVVIYDSDKLMQQAGG